MQKYLKDYKWIIYDRKGNGADGQRNFNIM